MQPRGGWREGCMMIDRPAFNYDNSGNPIVPAEASVEHNALVKGD
jgi:hypothetical protein